MPLRHLRPLRFALAALLALVASAGAGFAQSAAQAAVPHDRPDSAQALLAGEPEDVVEELMEERLVLLGTSSSDAGLVEALVLFSQPMDMVWELLIQRERQREYRPELTSVEVVERSPDAVLEEQHLRIAFLSVSYRLRNHFDL